MAVSVRTLEERPGRVIGACAGTVATLAALESTAWAGWPAPLPSAWSLLAVAGATRVGGLTAGSWSAVVALAYATYTLGFTTGHASGLAVWGAAGARVVVFGLASLVLVGLLHMHPRRAAQPRADDVTPPIGHAPSPTAAVSLPACETLREVARRSAHDLNNLLLVISASCELLSENTLDPTDPDLAAITEASRRCTQITTDLLDAALDASDALAHARPT